MPAELVKLTHPDTKGECIVPQSTAGVLETRGWKRAKTSDDENLRTTPPATTSTPRPAENKKK